jgi:UPF0755 protein
MKKNIKIIVLIIILIITLILLGFSYYIYEISPISNDNTNIKITINQNMTGNNIALTLKNNHLIRNTTIFKLYLKINGISNLKSGIYNLNKSMGIKEIVNVIASGKGDQVGEISILFKEGLNMRQIAKVIEDNTNNSKEEVFALLKDENYIDELISKYWFITDEIKNTNIYYPLEGYLAPNTYRFKNKDVSIKDIFNRMLDQMNVILTPYKGKYNKYTIHEYLTLASIVEAEGKTLEDRENIAGVLYNRLADNWSLGSDVTTYYAIKIDSYSRGLNKTEIDAYNPYNTRGPNMNGKLPIGPISNPSANAIKAAFEPNDNDYYYFVADKNSDVYFTKTSAEHNAKKQELINKGLWWTFD